MMAPAGVITPKLWKDPGIGGLQRLLLVLEHLVDERAEGAGMKVLMPALPSPEPAPPSIDDMMASVLRHAGPRDEPETYSLTAEGRSAAEQLRRSSRAYA
ncbi:MAG: hypothetical protein ACRDJK_14460, partial [Actinomycetota bacterium]